MSVKIDLEDVADWLVMLSSIDGQISPREERLLALFEDTHGLRPGLLVAMAQKKAQAAEKEVQLVDRNISRGYDFEKFVVRMRRSLFSHGEAIKRSTASLPGTRSCRI